MKATGELNFAAVTNLRGVSSGFFLLGAMPKLRPNKGERESGESAAAAAKPQHWSERSEQVSLLANDFCSLR